jgi:hypothetical protein
LAIAATLMPSVIPLPFYQSPETVRSILK